MEYVLIWLLFGIFSAVMAANKNRSGVGWFFVGALFGPFGLIVAFLDRQPEATAFGDSNSSGLQPWDVGYQEAKAKADAEPADTRLCPYCAETIKAAARICKHCQRSV